MSARCSLPPPTGRRVSRAPSSSSSSSSCRASRYCRAPSVSATARYSEDYRSAREGERRVEDTRITPGHYSYLALRARTPSTDRQGRQETPSKQLRFPRTNLGQTNNLTLLIKPSRKAGPDDFLPVEVVAVGGKVTQSPPREPFGGHILSSRRLNQEQYHTDKSYSDYFLKTNKRLGDMIRRVQNC